MYSICAAPLAAALWALLSMSEVQAGPIPKTQGLSSRSHNPDGSSCWHQGRQGHFKDGICLDLDINADIGFHQRSAPNPHRFTNYYADRTPCWVDGRRGWMKDHTCGDLINVDASIKIGKRFHNFDDPYFANGTPCFHDGRAGLLQDLLCAVLDVDVGDYYEHGWAGPWRFNRYYEDGRPCWVDNRRGWVHDQTCGNLIDIDADISIGRRFYKDDPYFVDGIPCLQDGTEGALHNYECIAADVHIQKRGYWGYYQGQHGLIDGAPCWQDGRQGVVGGLLCVVADVSIGKRRLLGPPDGDSCFQNGRFGLMKDGACLDIDIDADVVAKRDLLGSGHNGAILGDVLGGHGKHYTSDYGHYFEDELVDIVADIDVDDLATRGYYDPDELIAEVEAQAEVNADGINYSKRYFNHGHDGLDIKADVKVDADIDAIHHGHRYAKKHFGHGHDVLDVKADVKVNADVDAIHHGHRYAKRGGLLTNQNGVEGAVESIGKTAHNALGKRNFGHGYDHDHNLVDVDAKLDVNVDAGHRHGGFLRSTRSLLSGMAPQGQAQGSQPKPALGGADNILKSLGALGGRSE